jgi:hypothetical protein
MPGAAGVPDEWAFAVLVGPGGQAIIDVPAPDTPGLSRLLTHLGAYVYNTGAAAVGWGVNIESPIGTVLFSVSGVAQATSNDSIIEDLQIPGGAGQILRVKFVAAAAANSYNQIIIRGGAL